jgi:hypothetical protein
MTAGCGAAERTFLQEIRQLFAIHDRFSIPLYLRLITIAFRSRIGLGVKLFQGQDYRPMLRLTERRNRR